MKPRILFVVTIEGAVRAFLAEPLRKLSERFDIDLAVNSPNPDVLASLGIEGRTFRIPIERPIHPVNDLKALMALTSLIRREGYDAIHSVTPKAGLLAMLAGRLAGAPMRTHTFTGQVWATRSGASRAMLKSIDRVIHRLSTFSLVDSPSQRDFLLAEGVIRPEKSAVLADGSIAGVDLQRFRPDARARAEMREELGISDEAPVFLYVGRLSRDKGVLDLARAFRVAHAAYPDARLLVVGPDEENLEGPVLEAAGPGALRVGHTSVPERYMAAADVFCLPSYREGFGSVVIEAAAAGIPTIASRIYGLTDAVDDGVTGLLHDPSDWQELARLMVRVLQHPELRARMAAAAADRAKNRFSSKALADAWNFYYRQPPLAFGSLDTNLERARGNASGIANVSEDLAGR